MPLPLSPKRRKWVGQFKPEHLRGKPLNPNIASIARYYALLEKLIDKMTADYDRQLKKLFESSHAEEYFAQDATVAAQAKILTNELQRKFDDLFSLEAKPIAIYMADDADRSSAYMLASSLKELSGGLTIKTDVLTGELKDVLAATVSENVSLIKSISAQYHTQVQGAVMRSITTGNGLADLIPYLQKQRGVTLRRARIIANDQTRKAFANLNKGRMTKLGVQKFEWLHSAGGRVPRSQHVAMSGKIYSFDNLPVIDSKTGERGIPGQLINCRCRMIPVIDFAAERA